MASTERTLPSYTLEQVAAHSTPSDGWIVINRCVYDISKFYDLHPGSSLVLDPYLGGRKDATEDFFALHRSSVLRKYDARLKIGTLALADEQGDDDPRERPVFQVPVVGELSSVPFAEPAWLDERYSSPYFNDSHRRLQKEVRRFFDEHVASRSPSFLLPSRKTHVTQYLTNFDVASHRRGPGERAHPQASLPVSDTAHGEGRDQPERDADGAWKAPPRSKAAGWSKARGVYVLPRAGRRPGADEDRWVVIAQF